MAVRRRKKAASARGAKKANGTLKKGFRYVTGGRIVKAKAATKRKPAKRRRRR